MSTFSSLLSSITGGPQTAAASPGGAQKHNATTARPTQDRTRTSGGGVDNTSQAIKRKASSDAIPIPSKAPRKDVATLTNGTNTAPRAVTGQTPVKPTPSSGPSTAVPYRGSGPVAKTAASKPAPPKPATSSTPAAASASASAAKPITAKPAATSSTPSASTSAPAPAPKKGSYAEMMARAKAQAEKQAPVGAIKHKPVEKMTKKEKAQQLLEARKKGLVGAKDAKNGLQSRSRSPESSQGKKAGEQTKKKPLDLGYSGTMRKTTEPVVTYKGTMGRPPPSKASKSPYDRSRSNSLSARSAPRYRYASYTDEEEDDYDSEGSSAMEAGIEDVDQEEMLSLAAAKKEDEEALRLENELKRQKEERRKMLAKKAAEAAKKKQRF